MNLLDLDARWRRFHDEDRECPCCGRRFNGIFDVGFGHPDAWPHGPLPEGEAEVTFGDDKLGTDLCRLGEDRFIRCILPLPILGSTEVFHIGTWASVAPTDFYRYIDACFGEGTFEPCDAFCANVLPGLDLAEDEPFTLRPGRADERPGLMAQDSALRDLQELGLTFDQLLDIYAASGSDIRPHLTQ